VFRCIKAVLAPDGVLVMSTPRALGRPRNEFHTHEYTCEEFEEAFGRHFRYQRMMVENNHFTSLVADGQPELLDRIHALHPQFGLDQADYFIGLGTDGEAARLAVPRPVMVMNNEAYVKRLERDEAILQARRIELDAEVAILRSRLKETEERLSDAVAIDERVRTTLARFEGQSQAAAAAGFPPPPLFLNDYLAGMKRKKKRILVRFYLGVKNFLKRAKLKQG